MKKNYSNKTYRTNKLFNFLFSLCLYYKLTPIALQVDFLSYQKIQCFIYKRKFCFGYSKL